MALTSQATVPKLPAMSTPALEDEYADQAAQGDDTPPETDPVEATDQAPEKGRYERSTIAFPYGSLKDAEQIAQELHETWGGSTSPEQLAGGLDSNPRSGAFRGKVATARTFGLVSVSRGNIALTPLGRRIVDPQSRAAARVDAFLAVPLFAKVFESWKGYSLPPDEGLEQQMAEFGVSSKQTDKARQAFQRSAEQAGFFEHGRHRLVQPPANGADAPESPAPERGQKDRGAVAPLVTGTTDGSGVPLPELWLRLLNEGQEWSAEQTHQFVQLARDMHKLLARG